MLKNTSNNEQLRGYKTHNELAEKQMVFMLIYPDTHGYYVDCSRKVLPPILAIVKPFLIS